MISLTKEAAQKITSMSNEAGGGKLLRIFIEPGGCSGFEYGMSMDVPKDSDKLGESQGLNMPLMETVSSTFPGQKSILTMG